MCKKGLPPKTHFHIKGFALIEGIVLAAGLSTRMGRPKLDLAVDGVPLIARVSLAALDSGLQRVILVGGHSSDRIDLALADMAAHPRLQLMINPAPELGMSGSLAIGMRALAKDCSGVMIILGDQPLLTTRVINRLLEEFRADPRRIVLPLIQGRRSQPVVFPADLFPALTQGTGDVGGRLVLQQNAERVVGLEMGEWYDDTDVDTPSDLERVTEIVRAGKRTEA